MSELNKEVVNHETCLYCGSPKLHWKYSKEYKSPHTGKYLIPVTCLKCGESQDQEIPF